MRVKSVVVEGIRNLKAVSVEFTSGFNVIYGDNAQGKSSLLESVHLLCTSISYRTRRIADIVNWERPSGHIRGSIEVASHLHTVHVSLNSSDGKKQLVLNGKRVRPTDLLKRFPVVLVSRSVRGFVDGSQGAKRRFIDYLLFRIDGDYPLFYYRYAEILRNRNRLLRHGGASMRGVILSLGEQMLEYGLYISNKRRDIVDRINTFVGKMLPVSIVYESTIGSRRLSDVIDREMGMGYSLMGPHRDKVQVLFKDKPFDKFGSSGEKELYGVLVKMAEVEVLREHFGYWPVVILDDVDIMMVDKSNAEVMMNYLFSVPVQVLVATVYPEMWPRGSNLIHVRGGNTVSD